MSSVEAVFCRSAPWRGFARRVVLPWVLDDGERLGPEVLEIGGGSGAMAQELLTRHPEIRLTLADIDPEMAAAARRRLAPFGDRATVTVGDGTRLDFPDDSFDTVLLVADAAPHHRLGGRAGRGGARDPARRADRGLRPDRLGAGACGAPPGRLRVPAAAPARAGARAGPPGHRRPVVERALRGTTMRFRARAA